jgi:arginyl-tRNA synthetase
LVSQNFIEPATNLVEWVESLIKANDAETQLSAQVLYKPDGFDVALVGRSDTRRQADIDRLRDAATVGGRAGQLLVRLPDSRIAALGALLEEGVPDPFHTGQLARGDQWLVNFASSNATKALHVGHLRNIAIGHALASLAEAGGASVVRQSRVGDFGRNMGEAVAGYVELDKRNTPEAAGEKGDHFVGRCYAKYTTQIGSRHETYEIDEGDANAALSRERHVIDDLAESLLQRWCAGDREALTLFDRVRRWGVAGQNETLGRLGITMDRTLFESDFLSAASDLVEAALSGGIFERAANGATLYATGDAEYPRLLLTRSDDFPTQHLRYIATWRAIGTRLEGVRTVGILGSEWGPLAKYTAQILAAIDGEMQTHPEVSVVHGMVASGLREMHSSTGEAVLIDELLDTLPKSREMLALGARSERCNFDEMVAITVLGFFLGRPVKKRLSFTLDEVLDSRQNAGWVIAQAWTRAWRSAYDGSVDPEPGDSEYRLAIVRSQDHRRLMLQCLYRTDVFPLARYLFHLSTWFLAIDPKPRVARVMRTILRDGLGALGLVGSARVVD